MLVIYSETIQISVPLCSVFAVRISRTRSNVWGLWHWIGGPCHTNVGLFDQKNHYAHALSLAFETALWKFNFATYLQEFAKLEHDDNNNNALFAARADK